jgi:UDP-2,3-diacylglucosamine hydrolase
MRCLGTAIEPARDDGRARTILLSDLHVSSAGGPALEALAAVLADARARAAETRVIVLGDLFDVYATSAQLRMPRWDELAALLRATTAAGVPVTVLHGNRDFLLGRGFARATGCRVVGGGLALDLGGVRTICLHGDEACWRDHAYQRAKRLLRSAPIRVLSAVLPGPIAMKVGRRIRAGTTAAPRPDDGQRYDVAAAAIDRAFADTGAGNLVMGHVHRPAHHPQWRDGGGALWILPAFDEAGVHLVHEAGRFAVRGPDGAPRPPFPPRALT